MSTNREVFSEIAESWYRVRHWPLLPEELKELALRWKSGKLLNVGCAHGSDFLPFRQNFELFGIDFSRQMLPQAVKFSSKFNFNAHLLTAEAVCLPFKDDSFDCAIAVAVYHHIKGEDLRKKAFTELKRVLKPGSEAFITVWNRYQPRFLFKSSEQLVAWRQRNSTLYRYYHLFTARELRRILISVGFSIVFIKPEKKYGFFIPGFSQNICILVKK
jgi:SAM-dependent methyltransferase